MLSVLKYCQTRTLCVVLNLQVSQHTHCPQNTPQTYKYGALQAALQKWQPLPLQWSPARQDIPVPSLSKEVIFMSCCSLLHREVIAVKPSPWSGKSWAQGLAQPPQGWLKDILLSLGVESKEFCKLKLLGYADFLKTLLQHLPLQFPGCIYRFRLIVSAYC